MKEHLQRNRSKYFLLCFVFLLGVVFGVMSAMGAANSINALRANNTEFYLLVTGQSLNSFVMSTIVGNLVFLLLLLASCIHYYFSPTCVVILFAKAFSAAAHVCLILRCFGFSAVLLVVVFVPFHLLVFFVLSCWTVLLFECSRNAYYFGVSPWLIFSWREIAIRFLVFCAILIVFSAAFASIIVIFGGGLA